MRRIARTARPQHHRRVLPILLMIAFATFVSVASASADELAPVDAAAPAPAVVADAPAPVVEEAAPVAAADPAPVVVEAPAAPIADAPAAAEAAPAPAAPVVEAAAPAAPVVDAVAAPVVKQAAAPRALAAVKGNFCGNGATCRLELVGDTWRVSEDDSVRVCHATSGVAQLASGFDFITPNSDGIDLPGTHGDAHGGHSKANFGPFAGGKSGDVGDIVESFTYGSDANENGVIDPSEVHTYDGSNLGTIAGPSLLTWSEIYAAVPGITGASILASGCAAPAVAVPCGPGFTGDFQPNCTPIVNQCVPPMVGVYPNCGPIVIVLQCPAGTSGVFPICTKNPITCPEGSTTATVTTDVNGDERIDVNDCVAIVPTLCPTGTTGTFPLCVKNPVACPTGSTTSTVTTDVNGDGVIDAKDCALAPVTSSNPTASDNTPAAGDAGAADAGGPAEETDGQSTVDEPVADDAGTANDAADAAPDDNALPFTGFDLGILTGLGLMLLTSGMVLARRRRPGGAAR
jgi:hypothetical protein